MVRLILLWVNLHCQWCMYDELDMKVHVRVTQHLDCLTSWRG